MLCPKCNSPMAKITFMYFDYKYTTQELAEPYWECVNCGIEIDINEE